MLCLVPLPASADAPSAAVESRTTLLLPGLQISGYRDGTATFRAEIPILFGVGLTDFIVAPALQVATNNGLGALFSPAYPLPDQGLRVGLTAHRIQLHLTPLDENSPELREAKTRAWDLCSEVCPKNEPECDFSPTADEDDKATVDVGDLCPAGNDQFQRWDFGRAYGPASRFPAADFSVGFLVGNDRYDYLTLAADGSGSAQSERQTTASLGVAYSSVTPARLGSYSITVEARGRLDQQFNASAQAARLCQTAGTAAGGTVLTCSDTVLGGPVRTRSFTLAADVGVIDPGDGFWRAALGASLTRAVEGPDGAVTQLTLRLPISLDFALAPGDYKGDYSGIVRVGPSIALRRPNGGSIDASFLISLELLAQRSVFAGPLD